MNKKKKKILRTMIVVFYELIQNIMYSFIEEFDKIGLILEVIYPVFMVYCNPSVAMSLIFSILFLFVCKYLQGIGKAVNHTGDKGIPLPEKRFTEIDKDGFISMKNEEDFPEMLQYIYSLETYLQKRGRLK